jgi:hypothetical protein
VPHRKLAGLRAAAANREALGPRDRVILAIFADVVVDEGRLMVQAASQVVLACDGQALRRRRRSATKFLGSAYRTNGVKTNTE